jgi:Rieske Fe-S protein
VEDHPGLRSLDLVAQLDDAYDRAGEAVALGVSGSTKGDPAAMSPGDTEAPAGQCAGMSLDLNHPLETRRRFLAKACAGLAVTACGSACSLLPKSGQIGSPSPSPFELPSPGPSFRAGTAADYAIGSTTIFTDRRVGVLRDPNGFSAVRIECTHLGCTTRFFTSDQRWRCPCHGAEFDRHGRLLKGPATQPLRVIMVTRDPDGKLRIDPGTAAPANARLSA